MTIVQLRTLGALEVSLAATTVTAFPTDKIRALLVYLVLEKNNIHRREALAALFWPGIDPALALNNLRVTLHRLRETLDKAQPGVGSALIESTRQTLQLNHSLITTDFDTYQRLLTTCAAHAHAARHQCVECRARLVEAENLIYFAKRGSRSRQAPLEAAIRESVQPPEGGTATQINPTLVVQSQTPVGEPCLSVIDYMNWAVYRAFTRGEMRYYRAIEEKVGLLIDLYDSERYPQIWYNPQNPFDTQKITPL